MPTAWWRRLKLLLTATASVLVRPPFLTLQVVVHLAVAVAVADLAGSSEVRPPGTSAVGAADGKRWLATGSST